MGNKDNNESPKQIAKPPPNQTDELTKKEHNAEDARKKQRLGLIQSVIRYCFVSLGVFLLVIILDLVWFKKDIFDAPVFVIFITVISTTLTTAVGVVIGSSID